MNDAFKSGTGQTIDTVFIYAVNMSLWTVQIIHMPYFALIPLLSSAQNIQTLEHLLLVLSVFNHIENIH